MFTGFGKKLRACSLVLAMTVSVCSCKAESEITDKEQETLSSAPAPDVVYDVPESIPRTLVDQNGYRTGAEKAVVFRGEDLPVVFYVYNADTDELEYTGQMRNEILDSSGETTKIGYFTDLVEDGNYYIYTDELGSSYGFRIQNDLYDDIFNNACKTYYLNRCGMNLTEEYAGEDMHTACHTAEATLQDEPSKKLDVSGGWHLNANADRDVVLGCKIAQNLLLAYEMNPDSVGDDTGIPESGNGIPDILDEVKYEVDWLIKMQDERTGGVYGSAVTVTEEGQELMQAKVEVTPITMEATIRFAALLADFSFQYQSYDESFATECLKCADRAYSIFANTEDIKSSNAGFHAAARLYRATGSTTYEQVLTSFFQKSDFDTLFDEDEDIFFGGITYISTSQKVNVEICEKIMKLLMKKASTVASTAKKSGYLVSSNDQAQILDDMRTITIADHIIYNYEYTTIIENHAHYLMGRNAEAVNYVTDDTERTYKDTDDGTGILNQPLLNAKFIFMLSVIKE